MKRTFIAATLALTALVLGGCQKEHPINVVVDPELESAEGKIAVFPFMSALLDSDDPDDIAPTTMEKHFTPALNARNDYTFVSPNTLTYAISGEEQERKFQTFVAEYPRTGKIDPDFLGPLAEALKVEAFMIPVVDVWQKDEVDYQENASPATYVGATITIVDKTGQKILFRATDENYMEGARSETGDRGVVSTAGRVRSDSGAKTDRAPPYVEVAIMVINALVESLPERY